MIRVYVITALHLQVGGIQLGTHLGAVQGDIPPGSAAWRAKAYGEAYQGLPIANGWHEHLLRSHFDISPEMLLAEEADRRALIEAVTQEANRGEL